MRDVIFAIAEPHHTTTGTGLGVYQSVLCAARISYVGVLLATLFVRLFLCWLCRLVPKTQRVTTHEPNQNWVLITFKSHHHRLFRLNPFLSTHLVVVESMYVCMYGGVAIVRPRRLAPSTGFTRNPKRRGHEPSPGARLRAEEANRGSPHAYTA